MMASVKPLSGAAPGDVEASVPQRYLGLLADSAERLLAAADPAEMVDEIFALIRRELRLDVFTNYRFDGERLRLEAHGGLGDEEAAAIASLELGEAICGTVAQQRCMHHAVSIRTSADPVYAFTKRLGLDTYACTPLLHGDRLLGTLSFGRRWTNRFTTDELRFLRTLCHYVALAKYRLHAEAALRDGMEMRERLVAELKHRVRNALQVAVGLVGAEVGEMPVAAQAPLYRAIERLQILALAHRPLYGSELPGAIDVGRLIAALIRDGAIPVTAGKIAAAPPVRIETAAALALLLHALTLPLSPGEPVTLHLAMDARRMTIALNGLCHPDEPSRMVRGLLHQLRGTLAPGTGGTVLTLPVPHDD
ncbi:MULTISPECIES: GAF domain-containing protein [unclassified Sphingomonas]|jgi:GAF domain-containing protein|nr:GAF domain-containing protein [Sphingomonas sp. FARSPH]AXJ96671.1 hypothetical protein DM480_15435 [Sphingomonas sp. FARSPH]